MFIRLGQVYIDVDKIESIFVYQEEALGQVIFGICINNCKYKIFVKPISISTEDRELINTQLQEYVQKILNLTKAEIEVII